METFVISLREDNPAGFATYVTKDAQGVFGEKQIAREVTEDGTLPRDFATDVAQFPTEQDAENWIADPVNGGDSEKQYEVNRVTIQEERDDPDTEEEEEEEENSESA